MRSSILFLEKQGESAQILQIYYLLLYSFIKFHIIFINACVFVFNFSIILQIEYVIILFPLAGITVKFQYQFAHSFF